MFSLACNNPPSGIKRALHIHDAANIKVKFMYSAGDKLRSWRTTLIDLKYVSQFVLM